MIHPAPGLILTYNHSIGSRTTHWEVWQMGKDKGKNKPPTTTIRDVNTNGGDFVGRDKITNNNPPPLDPGIPALHQLPDPPADFVGRAAELDELCAAVQTQGALICGLTGLGGVGKTALGLVLASQLKAHYPDGQLYIHLRGASDKPLTPAAALEQLIRAFAPVARLPEDVEQLAAIYRTLLAGKQILVFLDDARDAAQVRALLPPRPALAIVTSRRRFDLAGYHTRDVSALPLDDAVKLICAVWGQTGEVTALAQRCGCLPMALRAAGALLRRRPDLTPARVDKLLTDAARRLALADPERETTVAAAFQASYDQLTPELQNRWRALGIFPADFDAPAAAAVWELDTRPPVVVNGLNFSALAAWAGLHAPTDAQPAADPGETLAELHAAGLVDAVTGGRWRLHDLARDFTRALCAPAEMDALAYRHAAYYMNVLTEANRLYLKGNENILAGLAQFDRERTHIEAGQAWAAAHPADPAAARLCNLYPDAGTYIIDLRLHPRAQITWREAALTAARALGNRKYEGFHLGNLGLAWAALGEPRRAIDYYEQRLVIAREIGDRRGEGNALGNLGIAWADLGEPRRAIDYYEQCLTIAREIGDRQGEANACWNLGLLLEQQGE
ncbi:MAG TPA: tetratricopeptide repeat protein, partial [Anaerolineaceae bacterium]|nr:tetratricopeptide repeat protein [Anaerolineaceae bacterium]